MKIWNFVIRVWRERPRGQEFIWWLIAKEGNVWIQWISPFLFLFTFAVCCWLPLRNAGEAFSLSLALLLQMYLHEMGHLFVFRRNGIRSRVWWLFPLGAVAAPINREENKKSDLLSWWKIAWLLQAGITVNVGLMGVGFLLRAQPVPWLANFGENLLYNGGILAISNLIPLWQLDGSLLYNVIFSSLKEKDDIRVSLILVGVLALAIFAAFWSTNQLGFWQLVITFFKHLGWFVVLIIIATGIWHRQGMDNPMYSASAQAMTRRQAAIHILFYIALLYLSLRLILGPLSIKL